MESSVLLLTKGRNLCAVEVCPAEAEPVELSDRATSNTQGKAIGDLQRPQCWFQPKLVCFNCLCQSITVNSLAASQPGSLLLFTESMSMLERPTDDA